MTGPRKPMPQEHRWFRVVAANGVVNVETTPWTVLSEANDWAEAYVGLAAPVVVEVTEDGGKTARVYRTVVEAPR